MSESAWLSPLVCRGLCFGTGWLLAHSSAAEVTGGPLTEGLGSGDSGQHPRGKWRWRCLCLRLLSWQVSISAECLTQRVRAVGSRWKDPESCAH